MSHATDSINPDDPSTWPTPRGPWFEAAGTFAKTRRYVHGAHWCAQAAGHPAPDGTGYPDLERHQPWNECQSLHLDVDDVRLGFDGPPVELVTYLARSFRFGEPRTVRGDASPRIMLELAVDLPAAGVGVLSAEARRTGGEIVSARISLSPDTALALSRNLDAQVGRLRRT